MQTPEAQESQNLKNSQAIQTQENQVQVSQSQATQTQSGQDLQISQTQQNSQVAPEVAQVNQEVTEVQDLTILDQRPLAGSLVNLDPSKPITVHLKVFKK